MDADSPSTRIDGEKHEVNEVENAHSVERVGIQAHDSEKGGLAIEGDGADYDGSPHKVHHSPILD